MSKPKYTITYGDRLALRLAFIGPTVISLNDWKDNKAARVPYARRWWVLPQQASALPMIGKTTRQVEMQA